MTVHMHSTVMRFIAALGTAHQHAMFYPDVVEDGKLFGSWGSEPESRGGATRRHTTIRRTKRGSPAGCSAFASSGASWSAGVDHHERVESLWIKHRRFQFGQPSK